MGQESSALSTNQQQNSAQQLQRNKLVASDDDLLRNNAAVSGSSTRKSGGQTVEDEYGVCGVVGDDGTEPASRQMSGQLTHKARSSNSVKSSEFIGSGVAASSSSSSSSFMGKFRRPRTLTSPAPLASSPPSSPPTIISEPSTVNKSSSSHVGQSIGSTTSSASSAHPPANQLIVVCAGPTSANSLKSAAERDLLANQEALTRRLDTMPHFSPLLKLRHHSASVAANRPPSSSSVSPGVSSTSPPPNSVLATANSTANLTPSQIPIMDDRALMHLFVRYREHIAQCSSTIMFDQLGLGSRCRQIDQTAAATNHACTQRLRHQVELEEHTRRTREMHLAVAKTASLMGALHTSLRRIESELAKLEARTPPSSSHSGSPAHRGGVPAALLIASQHAHGNNSNCSSPSPAAVAAADDADEQDETEENAEEQLKQKQKGARGVTGVSETPPTRSSPQSTTPPNLIG